MKQTHIAAAMMQERDHMRQSLETGKGLLPFASFSRYTLRRRFLCLAIEEDMCHGESTRTITLLSEEQRAEAYAHFEILRPALEEGVSQAQIARIVLDGTHLDQTAQALLNEQAAVEQSTHVKTAHQLLVSRACTVEDISVLVDTGHDCEQVIPGGSTLPFLQVYA